MVKEFSDAGSTPAVSTKRRSVELGFYKNMFTLIYRIEDGVRNHPFLYNKIIFDLMYLYKSELIFENNLINYLHKNEYKKIDTRNEEDLRNIYSK